MPQNITDLCAPAPVTILQASTTKRRRRAVQAGRAATILDIDWTVDDAVRFMAAQKCQTPRENDYYPFHYPTPYAYACAMVDAGILAHEAARIAFWHFFAITSNFHVPTLTPQEMVQLEALEYAAKKNTPKPAPPTNRTDPLTHTPGRARYAKAQAQAARRR